MSVQAAREYLNKIKTDQALQEKVAAASDLEAREQVIKAAGFDFTLAEYRQVIEEAAVAAGRQLTAEELDTVAGGLGGPIRTPGPTLEV